ncbi:hypothetical protein [Sinorhizobium fredii]|uniref:hypothetical protein n=1 Tax=Rhizobium fredii TaxID=380 RepID=UPI001F0A48DA|nr:hypothetical protein [Sinorhizobium fredii]
MSKANRITRLTSAACEQIQARMLEACRQIASDHGLVIESTGWRGLKPGFSFETSIPHQHSHARGQAHQSG